MIKHIVVPVDFSDCSLNALNYAISFIKEMPIAPKLSILNAYSIPLAYADLDITFGPGIEIDQVEALIDQEFEKLKKDIPQLKTVAYDTFKINHEVAYAIEDFNEDQKIDLIFMGTNGASGFKEKVLGSNTFQVIKANIAPVMVIPQDAKYSKISQIAFANDYLGIHPDSLVPLKEMTKLYQSTIHVIHIDKDGILEPQESDEAKNLALFLKKQAHQFHFIEETAVEEGLNKFLEEEAVDLLVVMPRRKGLLEKLFHKSESRALVLHSKLPLMTLVNK